MEDNIVKLVELIGKIIAGLVCIIGGIYIAKRGLDLYNKDRTSNKDSIKFELKSFKIEAKSLGPVVLATSTAWVVMAFFILRINYSFKSKTTSVINNLPISDSTISLLQDSLASGNTDTSMNFIKDNILVWDLNKIAKRNYLSLKMVEAYDEDYSIEKPLTDWYSLLERVTNNDDQPENQKPWVDHIFNRDAIPRRRDLNYDDYDYHQLFPDP